MSLTPRPSPHSAEEEEEGAGGEEEEGEARGGAHYTVITITDTNTRTFHSATTGMSKTTVGGMRALKAMGMRGVTCPSPRRYVEEDPYWCEPVTLYPFYTFYTPV